MYVLKYFITFSKDLPALNVEKKFILLYSMRKQEMEYVLIKGALCDIVRGKRRWSCVEV